MLICLASSRSRSWIRVSKSFRLSRQLNGASKSMNSSTYRLPPPLDDHGSFFCSSSSSPLPERATRTWQTYLHTWCWMFSFWSNLFFFQTGNIIWTNEGPVTFWTCLNLKDRTTECCFWPGLEAFWIRSLLIFNPGSRDVEQNWLLMLLRHW